MHFRVLCLLRNNAKVQLEHSNRTSPEGWLASAGLSDLVPQSFAIGKDSGGQATLPTCSISISICYLLVVVPAVKFRSGMFSPSNV